MRFARDERKNAANFRKHGVSFERAVRIFPGPVFEDIDDPDDYEEECIKATGLLEETEVVLIYTDRPGGERRIISARRVTAREREEFWKRLAR